MSLRCEYISECEMFSEEAVQFRRRKESLEASCEAYRGKNESQPNFSLEVGICTAGLKRQSLIAFEIEVRLS